MCQFLSFWSEIISIRKVLNLALVAFCQLFCQILNSLLRFTLCREICDSKVHFDTGWLCPRSTRLIGQGSPWAT